MGQAITEALTQLLNTEIARTNAMKSHTGDATPGGKEALRSVAEDVLRGSKATRSKVATIRAGIASPAELHRQGKETMSLAKSLDAKLVNETAKHRICVDLPGVQL